MNIGITERGDAGLDTSWMPWVRAKKPAILITKSPLNLSHLVDEQKDNIIIHCTITGMGGTLIEPGVRKPDEELEAYLSLTKRFGKDRVVLRIDPVVPTGKGISLARKVLNYAVENGRVRISFLDIYPHVQKRFNEVRIPVPYNTLHAPLTERMDAYSILKKERPDIELEVCGEPGFECTGCISAKDCTILGVEKLEKKGYQRPTCACLSLKKELLSHRGQCENRCIYCYWTSE